MSSNLGTILYGSLTVLPGYDTASSGFGDLVVSGTTLLSGASTTVSGTFTSTGAGQFDSTLTVNGAATFNSTVNFTMPTTQTGILTVTNTTNATSINDGALQVKGGMSVVKDSWMGGILNVAGVVTMQDALNVTGASDFTGVVTVSNTTESTLFSNGALVVAGGIGVAKDIRCGSGNIFLAGDLILNTAGDGQTYLHSPSEKLNINDTGLYDVIVNGSSSVNFNVAGATNTSIGSGFDVFVTTEATSTTTGAVKVAGGVGIVKNLHVGGSATITGTVTTGGLTLTATTQSTSTTTGALVVPGGVGIGKNTFIGGELDVASAAASESFIGSVSVQTDNGSSNWIKSGDLARTASAWVPLKFAPTGTTDEIVTINSADLTINATTQSTSTTSGALIVAGGAGIAKDVFLGQTLNVAGATKLSSDAWLSGNNLYLNAFNSQTDGLRYSATESAGGPLLFGANGGALATTSGALKVALRWDATQSVQIIGTVDTTSSNTGAFTVAGGVGVGKSLAVGTSILLQNATLTSGGDDIFINGNTNTVALRTTAGDTKGEFESTTLLFNWRTIDVSPYVTFQINKTSGYVLVLQTDDATGANTGAFQVSGGASISKSLWVEGNTQVEGDLTVSGNINTTGGGPVAFSSTVDSTSTTTGAVTIAGGLGVAKNVYIGGMNVIVNTTESTSTTTGAIRVAGGVGIVKDVYIGGTLNVETDFNVTGNTINTGTVTINDATASTNSTTGALVVAGGLGLGGALFSAGVVNITNATASTSTTTGALIVTGGLGLAGDFFTSGLVRQTNTTQATSSTTGALTTAGGAGIAKDLFVGGNTDITGTLTVGGTIGSGGPVTFSNTTESTSPTTGAVIVSGGLGVMKSLFVGSTNQSTSSATGGLVLSGGLGIAKDIFAGGNMTLEGTNPLFTFNNTGLAVPAFTTRSAGTKVLLYSALSPTASDFAIGMDTNKFWSSVPTNTGSHSFSWYGGTVEALTLDGLGNMVLNGTTEATSTNTGSFQMLGGAGIAKNVHIGGGLNVTGTSILTGTVTAQANANVVGVLNVTNVTNSTTSANGAIVTAGGLGVGMDTNIGGNVTAVNGTLSGTLDVTGVATVLNTTESTATSNGALVVNGGAGIAKNLYVGGNFNVAGTATVVGDLYVTGTQLISNTEVLSTTDNIILVNSAPAGTSYTGMAAKRYQLANDSGLGDIVNNDTSEETGFAQTGTTTSITLAASASAVDDFYNDWWIHIYGGTGLGQVRRIKDYDGTSKVATIFDTADNVADPQVPLEGLDFSNVPDATSEYGLHSCVYNLSIWNEVQGEYYIGHTPLDPLNPANNGNTPLVCMQTVHTGALKLDQTLYVDTIEEQTTAAGVTIETILLKDGDITGLNSINGNLLDTTSTIALKDDDINVNPVIPGCDTFGSYMVLVMDTVNTGAAATFFISNNTVRSGSVARLTSSKSASDSHLTIIWNIGEYPKLRYMALPTGGTGANVNHRVRVTRVV